MSALSLKAKRVSQLAACEEALYLEKLRPNSLSGESVVLTQRERPYMSRLLSRYLYRGVLPDKNIISDIDGHVQTQTNKVRALPVVEFLWLVL